MYKVLKNKKILVLGGAGFLGKVIVNNLLEAGSRVLVLTRFENKVKISKTSAQPGQLEIISANVFEEGVLKKYIKDKFAVINLCGILFERETNEFSKVHVYLPALIAKICKKNKIEKLIHVSALGASMNSKSLYSRSKALGEKKVIKNYKNAVILRPSIIFGIGDNFFGQFAKMSKFFPFLPIIGSNVKFQPVFVKDVAQAVINVLELRKKLSRTYELGGPKIYSFYNLISLMLNNLNRRRILIKLNPRLMIFPGYILKFFPNPPFTSDQMKLLMTDNIVNLDKPGLKDLGVNPSKLELLLPDILKIFKA